MVQKKVFKGLLKSGKDNDEDNSQQVPDTASSMVALNKVVKSYGNRHSVVVLAKANRGIEDIKKLGKQRKEWCMRE